MLIIIIDLFNYALHPITEIQGKPFVAFPRPNDVHPELGMYVIPLSFSPKRCLNTSITLIIETDILSHSDIKKPDHFIKVTFYLLML